MKYSGQGKLRMRHPGGTFDAARCHIRTLNGERQKLAGATGCGAVVPVCNSTLDRLFFVRADNGSFNKGFNSRCQGRSVAKVRYENIQLCSWRVAARYVALRLHGS